MSLLRNKLNTVTKPESLPLYRRRSRAVRRGCTTRGRRRPADLVDAVGALGIQCDPDDRHAHTVGHTHETNARRNTIRRTTGFHIANSTGDVRLRGPPRGVNGQGPLGILSPLPHGPGRCHRLVPLCTGPFGCSSFFMMSRNSFTSTFS